MMFRYLQEIGLSAVVLINPNYYTVPTVRDLQLDENRECWVDDFVVGHQAYGNAHFPGKTNVAGLDLDAIGIAGV